MNRNYVSPDLSVELFAVKDVITVSIHFINLTADLTAPQDSPLPIIDADEREYN